MIESASLDNVLGHLMFHKALIDEGRGAEKIDRYLGLLRSAEEEKQIAGREPLDRSLQLVFELVLSNDLDPWDVDLMKFAKLYGQRMHTEEVDFIVAGKLMHMAWSILHMQSREVLSLNERREELYFGEWDTESFDQFVEHPLPEIDLAVPECVELTEVVRHRCTRPVSLVDLLDAFDTAQQEVEIALNRQRVREMVAGREVLNCFAYSGAFTAYALAGGAEQVLSIDSSAEALALGKENLALNGLPAERAEWLEADVFQALRTLRDQGRCFDAIILDPPKFAPTAAQAQRAARGYKDINLLAFKLLRPGGLLFTFSCSGGISAELFQKIVAGAALDARVAARIVERLSQGPDHPVALNFPEGAYLKGLVCEVG